MVAGRRGPILNDAAYANAPHIPGGADYPVRWRQSAERYRRQAIGREICYGPRGNEQTIDVILPASDRNPMPVPEGLVVFVHGGFWRAFDRLSWTHLAAGAVAAGWAFAIPSYTLAPAARISEITRQIAAAIDAAARQVPGPVRLVGHSAGGHLVARMLMTDVTLASAPRLERCVPISPLADLRPLLATEMNADLRLDRDEAAAESPALHAPAREVATTVWVGADERPAFLDQARLLAQAWNVELVVESGRHHFDVIEGLERPDAALTRTVLGTG